MRRRASVCPLTNAARVNRLPKRPEFSTSGNGCGSFSTEAERIGLFAGLDISMDQTLTALEEIDLFYE
jgi:hypothetical protein